MEETGYGLGWCKGLRLLRRLVGFRSFSAMFGEVDAIEAGDVSFEIVSLLHTVVSGSLEVLRNDGGFEPLRSSFKLSMFYSNYW